MTHHVEVTTDLVFGADRFWCAECKRQFRDLEDHAEVAELLAAYRLVSEQARTAGAA